MILVINRFRRTYFIFKKTFLLEVSLVTIFKSFKMLVVYDSEYFFAEKRVVFKLHFLANKFHLLFRTINEVIVLTFLVGAESDYTVSSVFEVKLVLAAFVDVDLTGKATAVLVSLFKSFSSLDDIGFLSLVFIDLPDIYAWIVL